MSGISLSVDVVDRISPKILAVTSHLSDMRGLHNAMGYAARTLTREHLRTLNKHTTANRLGASPKGHWSQAAENTSMESDANSATVTISHPGIGRAMHDVTITPGAGNKCLTIPLIAQAYNLRAAAVWESEQLFVKPAKNAKGKDVAVAGKRLPDGTFQPWYLLVPSVRQAQDRSLLPSDTEYERAAVDGAIDYLQFVRRSLSFS